jgi:hypothetical protein
VSFSFPRGIVSLVRVSKVMEACGLDYYWFKPGVGTTDVRYHHNGTFSEAIITLKHFTRGDRSADPRSGAR